MGTSNMGLLFWKEFYRYICAVGNYSYVILKFAGGRSQHIAESIAVIKRKIGGVKYTCKNGRLERENFRSR